jgi:thiol-disulfide isomerase/thioredoxin
MSIILLLLKMLLSAVFAVAGVAKLIDWRTYRESLADFGVPAAWRQSVGAVLPFVEIAVAVLMLSSTTMRPASYIALILLAMFAVAIAVNLAKGRAPSCNCFGQSAASPIDRSTLVRSIVLLICAIAFVSLSGTQGSTPVTARTADGLRATDIGAWVLGLLAVLLAFSFWFNVNLVTRHGRMLMRLDNLELRLDRTGAEAAPALSEAPRVGLDVGTLAPAFNLFRFAGGSASLAGFLATGRPVVLLFSDSECGPCKVMLPKLAFWQLQHGDAVTLILVTRGFTDAERGVLSKFPGEQILLDPERQLGGAFLALVTPSAVRVNNHGLIDSELALGEDAILDLVAQTSGTQSAGVAVPPTTTLRVDSLSAAPA